MGHYGMSQAYHLKYQQSSPLAFNRPQQYMPSTTTFNWQPQPIMFGSFNTCCCHQNGGSSATPWIAGLVGLVTGGIAGYALSKKSQPQQIYYQQPIYKQPYMGYQPYSQYQYGQTGIFGSGFANQGVDYSSKLQDLYKAKEYNIVFNPDGTYTATDKNGNNVKGATGVSYEQMQIALG